MWKYFSRITAFLAKPWAWGQLLTGGFATCQHTTEPQRACNCAVRQVPCGQPPPLLTHPRVRNPTRGMALAEGHSPTVPSTCGLPPPHPTTWAVGTAWGPTGHGLVGWMLPTVQCGYPMRTPWALSVYPSDQMQGGRGTYTLGTTPSSKP